MLKIALIVLAVLVGLFLLLFSIYFFNLDMKLIVNVIVPVFEKHYDKVKRNQRV